MKKRPIKLQIVTNISHGPGYSMQNHFPRIIAGNGQTLQFGETMTRKRSCLHNLNTIINAIKSNNYIIEEVEETNRGEKIRVEQYQVGYTDQDVSTHTVTFGNPLENENK